MLAPLLPNVIVGDYVPVGAAGFVWSVALGVVVLGLGAGSVLVWVLVRSIRLARQQAHEHADMLEHAKWVLVPGPARVISGRVDLDGGVDVAAEVDIHQNVLNQRAKNSEWHVWRESWRETRAVPFKLVRADGQIVVVEPGDQVFIVDSLATKYPENEPEERVRAATVRRDEDIFAYGDLYGGADGHAYRGGAGFVLRPPRGGRMLIATEAIRDRYAHTIRYLRLSGFIMAALFVLYHGFFTVPFVLAAVAGTETTGTVVNARQYTTHGKGGPRTHYMIKAKADDGFTLEDEVELSVYQRVVANQRQGAAIVPMLRTGDATWASYLGTEPSTPGLAIFFAFMIALPLLVVFAVRFKGTFAWYDRTTLSEHGGTGWWVETRSKTPGLGTPIDPTRN